MRKKVLFVCFLMLLLGVCFAFSSCSGSPSQEIVSKYESLKPGDKVALGNYNGEELQWIVASSTGDKMLLISQKAIESKEYTSGEDTCTWDAAPIREWLNNEFIETAFSSEEKTVILDTEVVQDENPEYEVELGETTVDKVFLLSIKEANKYLPTKKYRKCSASNYVKANSKNVNNGVISWWLRTPGEKKGATYVFDDGVVYNIGTMPNFELGVRPAMWVSLGKDAKNAKEKRITEVEPFSKADFIVSKGDAKKYVSNGNYYDELKSIGSEEGYQCIYFDPTNDESKSKVITTARGIKLGSKKSQVIAAYGDKNVSGDFDRNTDLNYCKIKQWDKGEETNAMMEVLCKSFVRYSLKNKSYSMTFYFDDKDEVSVIFFSKLNL